MMHFHGGPLDGKREEPRHGWPAPDILMFVGQTGEYRRYEVDDSGTHHYQYAERQVVCAHCGSPVHHDSDCPE